MVCVVENRGAQCRPHPLNSAGLTLRAHKKGIAVLAQSSLFVCLGYGWVGRHRERHFEFISFRFLALLVFLAEVIVLLSPLVHLTPFLGW